MATTPTIAALAPQTLSRLEDPAGIFWGQSNEIYSAIIEACNDLLLLIGRPTQVVQQVITIQPNQWFQTKPNSIWVITDIYGGGGRTKKLGLFDLDFALVSWDSGWEQDVGPEIDQWAPLGMNAFAVHPCITDAQQVLVTGIAPATTGTWPYAGATTVPFPPELESAIEMYAAHYCRFKEGGAEFQASLALYQEYLEIAKRFTQIEDRRDPLIFTNSMGGQTGVAKTTAR